MRPFFFGLRDFWGRWSVDHAGVQSGDFSTKEIRAMLDRGEIGPHSWLRHAWTQRFALVGEALAANQLATAEEFEAWFPLRRQRSAISTL